MSQLTTLAPLPYPIYFVCKHLDRWQDLLQNETLPADIPALYERCLTVSDIWSAQPYITLKRRGLNVQFVPDYVPDQICLIPSDDLQTGDRPYNSYVVACRADRARPEVCEQRLVINELNVIDETDHLLPHFPQPNLVPRNSDRGNRVETLVFKGMERNLAAPFKTEKFKRLLEEIGVRLVVSSEAPDRQFQEWADYSEADVVLAVRNNTEYDLTVKPALKLINAWLADCPAILGPEPAYRAIRQSELDFIEVRTMEEVVEALQRLKEDPALYAAMVENGRRRVKDFTEDQVALCWREALGAIVQDYERWRRQSFLQKKIGRPIQFLLRRQRHQRAFAYHQQNIFQGKRLFGDE
jgi:hypothetical protein